MSTLGAFILITLQLSSKLLDTEALRCIGERLTIKASPNLFSTSKYSWVWMHWYKYCNKIKKDWFYLSLSDHHAQLQKCIAKVPDKAFTCNQIMQVQNPFLSECWHNPNTVTLGDTQPRIQQITTVVIYLGNLPPKFTSFAGVPKQEDFGQCVLWQHSLTRFQVIAWLFLRHNHYASFQKWMCRFSNSSRKEPLV